MANSFITSALTAYRDQSTEFIRAAVLADESLDFMNVREGIKGTQDIPIINATLVPKAYSCGTDFNGDSTTAITQIPLTTCKLTIEEKICLDTLEGYFTQTLLPRGTRTATKLPQEIAGEFYADHIAKLGIAVADYMWLGSSTGTFSAPLTLCDGFLHKIELTSASASVVQSTTFSGVAITQANVTSIVEDMIFYKMPTDMVDRKDKVLFTGISEARILSLAILDKYKYNAQLLENYELAYVYPGTDVTIVGVRALTGKRRFILTYKENFIFGTDLKSDFDNGFAMESPNGINKGWLLSAVWRQGVAIAFPQFVVYNK